jgi:hypothetical protein
MKLQVWKQFVTHTSLAFTAMTEAIKNGEWSFTALPGVTEVQRSRRTHASEGPNILGDEIAGHFWWFAEILPDPSILIDLELFSNIIRCKIFPSFLPHGSSFGLAVLQSNLRS